MFYVLFTLKTGTSAPSVINSTIKHTRANLKGLFQTLL